LEGQFSIPRALGDRLTPWPIQQDPAAVLNRSPTVSTSQKALVMFDGRENRGEVDLRAQQLPAGGLLV
jgi:hypothetical protein